MPSYAAAAPVPEVRAGVAVTGLCKAFGGVPALSDVALHVRRGEIHGLLGENGSGKSTLIKVLSGFHAPEAGVLHVDGEPVALPLVAGGSQRLGFAFVHQDLGLIPTLSVLENLRLPYFAAARTPKLSWGRLHQDADVTLRRYGVTLDTHAKVADLPPVQRSMLAIVRAVDSIAADEDGGGIGSLLVLDEPTVYLPQRELDVLFRLVREVAARGTGVLFVSHDLDEVQDICDRVTVLRDGKVVGTLDRAAVTKSEMIRLIVGHDPAPQSVALANAGAAEGPASGTAICARVEGVSGEVVDTVSFDIGVGETLGVTGLAGSGFAELPYLLYGAGSTRSGTLSLGERRVALSRMRPNQAVGLGIILIPGNRQVDGLVQTLTLTENLTLPRLGEFFRGLRLRRRKEQAAAQEVLVRFTVRPNRPALAASSLSGGNQQKVLLGKWLQMAPRLLLFDEPTQGVDVGARAEIFRILQDETARGAGILCASSDHEQLALICDRVLIMARGVVVAELAHAQLTKEEITRQCLLSLQ